MSRLTIQLLEAFEKLPEEEKRIFAAELLRRTTPFDSGLLDDAETARAADLMFCQLDEEENEPSSR